MCERESLFSFLRQHFVCFVNWRQITLGANLDFAYGEAVVGIGPLVVGWSW